MPWLDYGGRLRKLPDGCAVIGSGTDATIRVDDLDLMPRHVVIETHHDHLAVRAYSPDVVVAHETKQIGTDACRVPYGEVIRAGSGELRVWQEQPAQSLTRETPLPRGYLVDEREQVAYPLDRLCTNVGRARANVIRLRDPAASRFHAQVRREAGGFALHVVGSAGGSVNGRRVSAPTLLEEGDMVELAYAGFRFTRGPVPDAVRILPRGGDERQQSERPTITHERVTIRGAESGTGRLLRVAFVAGMVLAALATWLVLR